MRVAFHTPWDAGLQACLYHSRLLRSTIHDQFFAAERNKADPRQLLPGSECICSIHCVQTLKQKWGDELSPMLAHCLVSKLRLGISCQRDSERAGRWQDRWYPELPQSL